MATPSPIPVPAHLAAAAHCGAPITWTEVTDRRGSAVLKATGPAGSAAVKIGRGLGRDITAREAAVLARLDVDYLIASGLEAAVAWLVTEWLDGPTTWEVFEPVRAGSGGRPQALEAAVETCRAVAELHAQGWVHADLQPEHTLHTSKGARLIDMAWAWRPGWDQGGDFNGGLTHLVAPELARQIITGEKPVPVTPEADVYALAGVLWTCTTGTWPLDYAAAGIDRHALTAPQLRHAIATSRIPLTTGRPWPGLQTVLEAVLEADAADRPTAAALADQLAAAPVLGGAR